MKKLMLSLLPALAVFLPAIGCHGQVAPTTYVVALTWTAPAASGSWAGCSTASPCTYVVSRYTLTSGTTCPTATTQYTPLNQSSPVSTASYTDSSAPTGVSLCYVAQTEQGTAISQPSSPSSAVAVPGIPLAPSAPTGDATTAKEVAPNGSADTPGPVVATLRPR